ncbi:cytochrome ubiquinol oxidase subunit I [Acidiferrimicrobium sp. IK]|uniref:cytochrome ubiquinol oxidase subunit I n=1 Tax=Acidiferrimicrobium sp. IK TaxID=2871700 RepID=UPI0021CB45CE|nr:cytochrome ubiquinol oxidase subunit I [Acidiferrimicrobium sp. IK]MCU4182870.1 cytochrome ubiquinol oxidase subunit I [Acidiferrimicrobium sp. IK]
MSPDSLARWQFASTTIYHFIIVPVSIGLGLLVATMQTLAYRRRGTASGHEWDRAARFWGKLLLISFAIGVVTGIVQEFQFGMNWSAYSRFVGDIFGAPLAMEALIAFFLESTFLGLWIFGRDLLGPKLHLLAIWCAAIGSAISAYFILAANSFMQHPVGYRINPVTHRAELTSIWKVLTNSTQLVTFPHTLLAAILTGAVLLIGVSAWHLRRDGTAADVVHTRVLHLAVPIAIVAAVGVSLAGHVQGQIMTKQQPMKMAAAEALWNTKSSAPFSLFAYGDVSKGRNKIDLTVPDGLSILATNRPSGTVQGINQIQAEEQAKYGNGNYVPVVGLAYWCFRLMIGFGALAGLVAAGLAVQWRRGRLLASPRLLRAAVWAISLPLLANTAGWLFTETARQPWLVFGVLKTADGVSPNVSNTVVAFSLVGFVVLYGVLGVIAARLFAKAARQGPDTDVETLLPPGAPLSSDGVLSLAD